MCSVLTIIKEKWTHLLELSVFSDSDTENEVVVARGKEDGETEERGEEFKRA